LGPVFLIAALILLFTLAVGYFFGKPDHPTDHVKAIQVASGLQSEQDLTTLLDYQLKDYKANLAKLDANISLQALLIAITVLLIVRRSDSLTLFGNSVPLSWLHFFVPVLLIYLWLNFGFTLHELIWGRIRGIELINALNRPIVEYQKAIFHDAGIIDGWFLAFVDTPSKHYSGINQTFSPMTGVFLLLMLGTFVSAAHASTLAIVSFGYRRYLRTGSHRGFTGITSCLSYLCFFYSPPTSSLPMEDITGTGFTCMSRQLPFLSCCYYDGCQSQWTKPSILIACIA
jgi:hypothetical protein